MATAATVSLSPDTSGVLHVPKSQIAPESCSRASELLQKNHDDYHMYFNSSGFHNHIAHHLLTIFALGANAQQLQKAYNDNANYQRPQFPVDKDKVESMSDPAVFAKYLNNEKYFHDFEIYFRKEIEKRNGSWQQMLNDQLFADTDQAKDLFVRMFAGFYHPIIHLGFGIEFEQPAIIVEALAQASTHDRWPGDFVQKTTELANKRKQNGEKSRSLFDLLREARSNDKIRESPHWEDGNKVRDGVLKRAMSETADLCSQWLVQPTKEDLRLKTAEMTNFCAYFASAAQHPSRQKQLKFDFFYMHCINCSIFYSAFIDPKHDSWLKDEDRVRLLQFKGWSDISMYISRGSPELLLDEVTNYMPKQPEDGWAELFERVDILPDDGHASKLVRAMANGQRICAEYEGNEGKDWPFKGDTWLKAAHMAIDSVEGTTTKWVRNAGFDQAWKDIPDRSAEPNASASRAAALDPNASKGEVAQGYHEN
ncbi:hypothetical protein LTS08_008211 [Lithohypha guttulata]|uniref:uncharacterized protein n=1 Tax=Lithohypha guttulata TaxID=1690604 RepID=UPI002DDF3425|nr:hypothetical protein LTR51_006217 [Lithohypha guttulata]KAK5095311.1 hypothetical protein LTS08_008211 [Lithohypha guttulata]